MSLLGSFLHHQEKQVNSELSRQLTMVGVVRRSLSFPNKLSAKRQSEPSVSCHVRSVSLPCTSHPLISHLKDIMKFSSWSSETDSRTSGWICDGLTRLRSVHDYLVDILHFPQSQASLNCQPHWVEKFLECFLCFVDVYGIFQTLILAFKMDLSAAHVAMRRNDAEKIALFAKARKRMAKETAKLVTTIRCIRVARSGTLQSGDDELIDTIGEVIEATSAVSIALFDGISRSLWPKNRPSGLMKLTIMKRKTENIDGIEEFQHPATEILKSRWRREDHEKMKRTMKKMETLEKSTGDIEAGSDRVFRSLINVRVSLLNILTQ